MFRLLFFKGLGLTTAALFLAAANSFSQNTYEPPYTEQDTLVCKVVLEQLSESVYFKKTICVVFQKPVNDTIILHDTVYINQGGGATNGMISGGVLRYETTPTVNDDLMIPSYGMVKKLVLTKPILPDPINPIEQPKPDLTQVFFSSQYTRPVVEIDYNLIPIGGAYNAEVIGYYYNATGAGKDMSVKLQSGTKDISQPATFGSFPSNGRMHPVKFTLNIIRTNQTDVYAWCTVWSANQLFTTNSYATSSQMSQFGTINATANAGKITLSVGGFNADATKNYFRRDAILYK